MPTWLMLMSLGLMAISGVPGLLLGRRVIFGQWIATGINLAGSGVGAYAIYLQIVQPELAGTVEFGWALPLGRFSAGIDDLSALFLIPMVLVSGLGAIYGLEYWNQSRHPTNGRKLRLFWGLMTAGMMGVVLARDAVFFLIAWEVMALSAFFLVTTESNKPIVREAGWVYLVATHVGTLSLFGFFALLHQATGSFALWQTIPAGLSQGLVTGLFVLGAVGFGLKAGVMPLHVWLPGAHANAPSHVSAMLSGVLLKTGIYGLFRLSAIIEHPPIGWGVSLLVAGGISALLGITFSMSQRDFKRLLAYSSVENIGIIVMGIGLALMGRALGRTDLVILGMGGALFHVLNHSLFKPLLFLGAGSVLHATHTREMDLLGGLGQKMPRTSVLFLIGAVAICGLPPLNGFVSELFIYLGLFKTLSAHAEGWGWASLGAPVLAMVGTMAVAGFVKVFGIVFGGLPRSSHVDGEHDPNWLMLAPMSLLAISCIILGLFPTLVVGLIDRAIIGALPPSEKFGVRLADQIAFGWITGIGLTIFGLVACGSTWLWLGRRNCKPGPTWDCAYSRPTARMQYTGSSFSQILVGLLAWVLIPIRQSPRIRRIFPNASGFHSEIPDTVLERGLVPAFNAVEWLTSGIRLLQRGPAQVYLVYVLAMLLLLLCFA